MSEEGGISTKERWATPYAQAGGFHSLSGSALAAVARDVLSRGHSFRFLAPGASMSPFIRDGDVLTLFPFDGAACAPGDVVAFILPGNGRLVVHRIVAMEGDRCLIRGDNNSEDDGALPYDAIIGRVMRVERAGRVVRFGLGPERVLIALLSRRRWLPACMSTAKAVYLRVRRFF